MMKYMAIVSALVLGAAPATAATPITYAVSGSIGSSSYSYTLTTDGTIGALTDANILDYSFSVASNGPAHSHKMGDAQVVFGLGTGVLSATSTALSLNFDSAHLGDFMFVYGPNSYADSYSFCAAGACGAGARAYVTVSRPGQTSQDADDLLSDSFESGPLSGTVQVGTAVPTIAAVPEPATWAMMTGGFGLLGAAMRRRKSVAVASTLA